jgi:hypothetical protein
MSVNEPQYGLSRKARTLQQAGCLSLQNIEQTVTKANATMDSPVVSQIFRQLFTSPARCCLRHYTPVSLSTHTTSFSQRRTYALRRPEKEPGGSSRWQQRIDAFPKNMSKQLKEYPRVIATDLKHRTQRPRRVRMLTRDFIDG